MFLPMNPAVQGGMAEGAVLTGAGGMPAMGAGAGPVDPDVPGGARRPGRRGAVVTATATALGVGAKSIANVATQVYRDNQDNEDKKCLLFPYSERAEKCPKGTGELTTNAHHAIPDHCWRTGGVTQKTINTGLKEAGNTETLIGKMAEHYGMQATQKLDDLLPGGDYYYSQMDKEKSLAICVTGKGKKLQHGDIHKQMDRLEDALGAKSKPQYTATLGQMEEAAAESISNVTGCDKQDLINQMRKYHDTMKLDPDKTILRADSGGKNTSEWGKDPILGSRTGADQL